MDNDTHNDVDAMASELPGAISAIGNLRSALPAPQAPLDVRVVVTNLLTYAERNLCMHEDTYRGGAIWEICRECGQKWADDRGGRPADTYGIPSAIADAHQLLKQLASIDDQLTGAPAFVKQAARDPAAAAEVIGDAKSATRRIANFRVRSEPTRDPDFAGERSVYVTYNGRQEHNVMLAPHEAQDMVDLLIADFGLAPRAAAPASGYSFEQVRVAVAGLTALRDLLADVRANVLDGDAARDAQALLDSINDDDAPAAPVAQADDTARLDWLEKNHAQTYRFESTGTWRIHDTFAPLAQAKTLRAAIDAARALSTPGAEEKS